MTLKHLLQRRPIVPQPSASGVDYAQPFSPMKVLALLSTLQSADIVLPTKDGREIRLRRITEPTTEQKSRLRSLTRDRGFERNRLVSTVAHQKGTLCNHKQVPIFLMWISRNLSLAVNSSAT